MAGHRNGNGNQVGLVPEAPARTEYERDFYSWLAEQAHLLRESRFDALDRENLAEEIESLGREQFNKLESALRVLLTHILKWDHQPRRRSRSWVLWMKADRSEFKSRTCCRIIPDSSPACPRRLRADTAARVSKRRTKPGSRRAHFRRLAPIHSMS